jgi:hypothetical protein
MFQRILLAAIYVYYTLGDLSKNLLPYNTKVATPKNIQKLLHGMHKLGAKNINEVITI